MRLGELTYFFGGCVWAIPNRGEKRNCNPRFLAMRPLLVDLSGVKRN